MNLTQRRLKVLKSAERELDDLPEAAYKEAVNAIADLIEDPYPPGSIPLRNYRDVYRIRVYHDRYRLVYRVSEHQQKVVIWRVRPRATAYIGL